jgi:DNA-binding MarR family transcriptional regulator
LLLAIELALVGPATTRQLASRLGVTPAAVSLLVDRMVDHGWVERERDEEDRRVVWARLTPMAQSMSEALLRVQRAQVVTFLAEVPEHEREPFVRNLAHFARVLARANDKGQLQTV